MRQRRGRGGGKGKQAAGYNVARMRNVLKFTAEQFVGSEVVVIRRLKQENGSLGVRERFAFTVQHETCRDHLGSYGISFSAMPLLLPLIREDLHITFTQAGLLSAAATFSYALGQIPAGFLADRYGAKRLFFIGLVGCLALSFSFAWVTSFEGALINQLFSGAFRALLFTPGLVLITAWYILTGKTNKGKHHA